MNFCYEAHSFQRTAVILTQPGGQVNHESPGAEITEAGALVRRRLASWEASGFLAPK